LAARLLLVAVFFLTWITVGGAEEPENTNPHTTPEDVAAGGRIYRSHCVECHGRDGTGGRGPDITRGDLRYGNSDAALADTISTGIPGTSMPLFFFNGKQLWQIVAFVQSLRREEPRPPGDSSAGAALFRGKGACVNCHMVDGQGGRQGPDLTTVGARRSLRHLRSAVLDPDQWVHPRDWKIQAKTRSGALVGGVRLNEDTHSLQLLDSGDKLISLVKSDLESYRIIKSSAMPPYAGQLSQSELDDLVAYLYTLRGKGVSP
jgi:putative heme-binding domain-containing protein